jgi:hypothetical protein
MADPVKISELPAISSVQANDILPVVDAALTQTSKCTAAQIAAIGGGPPGDGTVTTAKIVAGAVTASKTGFTGPDKLVSRILTGAGEGVEIPCTGYARGLLATGDSAGALAYLGGLQSSTNPTFNGTVTVNGTINSSGAVSSAAKFIAPVGSAATPSFTFDGDADTGLAQLGGANTLSVVTGGAERLRFLSDGTRQSYIGSALFRDYGIRAFCNYTSGSIVGGNVSSVVRVSTGFYNLNFAQPMPDTSYTVMAMNGYGGGEAFTRYGIMTTTYVQLSFADTRDTTGPTTGSWQDQTTFMLMIAR